MKLEQQCCSLELAKRLKSLGVKQESLFYWVGIADSKNVNFAEKPMEHSLVFGIDNAESYRLSYETVDIVSAFTVAELGEMMPNGLDFIVTASRGIGCWYCEVEHIPGALRKRLHFVTEPTEANARAKALIWLIENGHVTP